MTSPESSGPDCWPNDQGYLDGRTQMFWPSQDGKEVGCYFDTALLDLAGRSLSNQINVGEPFQVRFRAEARQASSGLMQVATGLSISLSRRSAAVAVAGSTCLISCRRRLY